ncbi:MAG: pyridoxine 5'-phosphate synthase [Verrucomicrobiales bacterium]|jgi:pyridoxine 5-phosphate synthase|nr:pyridoxine 5'-phosphate synthase [Verrucomicrobiales bacterium]
MLKLGLNIDHVATLRQARYRDYAVEYPLAEPSPLAVARLAVAAGAHAITAHLREDRRHIQDADVDLLKQLGAPLNLEMAVTDAMVAVALTVRPRDVCLVPENRREVTTEGGLNVSGQLERVTGAVRSLSAGGVTVSLFIDPDEGQVRAAKAAGAPCVELHTGAYANALAPADRDRQLAALRAAAELARGLGLQVNAGHGLNYQNLPLFIRSVPHLDTLNIGHAVIARALTVGIERAVREMLGLLRGGESQIPLP